MLDPTKKVWAVLSFTQPPAHHYYLLQPRNHTRNRRRISRFFSLFATILLTGCSSFEENSREFRKVKMICTARSSQEKIHWRYKQIFIVTSKRSRKKNSLNSEIQLYHQHTSSLSRVLKETKFDYQNEKKKGRELLCADDDDHENECLPFTLLYTQNMYRHVLELNSKVSSPLVSVLGRRWVTHTRLETPKNELTTHCLVHSHVLLFLTSPALWFAIVSCHESWKNQTRLIFLFPFIFLCCVFWSSRFHILF